MGGAFKMDGMKLPYLLLRLTRTEAAREGSDPAGSSSIMDCLGPRRTLHFFERVEPFVLLFARRLRCTCVRRRLSMYTRARTYTHAHASHTHTEGRPC